jgi:hypothetical protein
MAILKERVNKVDQKHRHHRHTLADKHLRHKIIVTPSSSEVAYIVTRPQPTAWPQAAPISQRQT